VVLAAGGALRFGGPKLLAPLHGRPLVAHALDAACRARAAGLVGPARVVVAAGDEAVPALARAAAIEVVVNDAPGRGLSGSLRLGLAGLGDEVGAAIILLGDQPLVRDDVLGRLIAAWRAGRGTLVRPRYAEAPDEPGHPVLASRSLWPLADRLEGEAGFGALFRPGSPEVALIDAAGRNPDVDTPADLHMLEGSSP